jgi:hypothetical protein
LSFSFLYRNNTGKSYLTTALARQQAYPALPYGKVDPSFLSLGENRTVLFYSVAQYSLQAGKSVACKGLFEKGIEYQPVAANTFWTNKVMNSVHAIKVRPIPTQAGIYAALLCFLEKDQTSPIGKEKTKWNKPPDIATPIAHYHYVIFIWELCRNVKSNPYKE